MPRKSRRSRRSRGSQTAPRPPAPAGIKAAEHLKSGPAKQVVAGRPLQSTADIGRQFHHLRSDIRRIIVCSGVCAVLLVIIYFLIR